jgi:hypothetical protein
MYLITTCNIIRYDPDAFTVGGGKERRDPAIAGSRLLRVTGLDLSTRRV